MKNRTAKQKAAAQKISRARKLRPAILASSAAALLSISLGLSSASAATVTWDGFTGDSLWSSDNWSNAAVRPVTGDDLVFVNGANFDPTSLSGTFTNNRTNAELSSLHSITFNNNAGAITLNGNALGLSGGGITNSSAVNQNVSIALTFSAGNAYNAANAGLTIGATTNLNGNTLTTQGGNTILFNASVTGSGALINNNTSTVTLTGANTYSGGTTISAGYLLANNGTGSATGTGGVAINGGTLAGTGTVTGLVTLNSAGGGGAIEAGANGVGHGTQGTLHLGAVTWNGGGKVNLELGTTSDLLALTGALTKGTAGAYSITITDAGRIGDQNAYTLATFASTTFAAGDFTLALPAGYSGALIETGTELDLLLAFASSGSTIQNTGGPNTPKFADFTVTGNVGTGGPADNNTVNSLTFTPGGKLTITNTLTVTSGDVTTTGGNSTITGGTLSGGPNGLHFDVNGNLFIGSTLIGNAVKTGTGSLFLDGALFGNLTLLQGLLGGNGTITGDLYNAGTVSPGHSPGHLQVGRNYIQASTGILDIQIGGRDLSQHDLLSVGGAASLNGTLVLERLNGFKLKRNKPVTFLTANGGVSGQFATVINDFTSDTILEPTVVYHQNSVALEAVQGSFEKFAQRDNLTPNQKSVARALDSVAFRHSPPKVIDYLDDRKLNELPRDFDRIAPADLTSIFTIGIATEKQQSLNLQRRTDDIRSGSNGFSAAGLAINGQTPSYSGGFGMTTGVAGPSGDDGKEAKTMQTVAAPDNRWGVFLSGTGEWVNVSGTDNARGYNLDSGGFTLGLDYKVTPNFAIGLMAGYTGSSSDLVDRGRVWVNGGQLGVYATFFQNEQAAPAPTMSKDASKEAPAPAPSTAKGFYADIAATGGYNSYDTRLSALQGEARGDTDGGEINALFGMGYDFKSGGLTFGPTASFNYTYVGINEFTERGSLAPLNVRGSSEESLRTAFGLKASYDWRVGGMIIKPELRAAWQHEYGDTSYAMNSSFANGAGGIFTVRGPEIGRDSLLLGAGVAILFNERTSLYFYYDSELARTNYDSHSVTGGLRLAF